jgi:hypothetical protein
MPTARPGDLSLEGWSILNSLETFFGFLAATDFYFAGSYVKGLAAWASFRAFNFRTVIFTFHIGLLRVFCCFN